MRVRHFALCALYYTWMDVEWIVCTVYFVPFSYSISRWLCLLAKSFDSRFSGVDVKSAAS